MAGRLCAAGADVDQCVYPAAPHGVTGHPTSMAQTAALTDIKTLLSGTFDPVADEVHGALTTPVRL